MGQIVQKASNQRQPTAVGSLQFGVSEQGHPITLIYGTNRVALNVVDLADFTNTAPNPAGGNKGKGGLSSGKGGSNTLYYSASFIFEACQGPVQDMWLCWLGQGVVYLNTLPGLSTVNLGGDGQNPDPYWVANHPDHAIGYSGTANVTLDNYRMGASPTTPNLSVEIRGLQANSSSGGWDANPAYIIIDLLTNPRYGAGFPADRLDPDIVGTYASLSSYCDAAGIFHSLIIDSQQECQQILDLIATGANAAVVWSGGLLKVIPYGDTPLTTSYQSVFLGGVISPYGGDVVGITFSNPTFGNISVQYVTSGLEETYSAVAAGLIMNVIASMGGNNIWAAVQEAGLLLAYRTATAQQTTIGVTASGGVTISIGPMGPVFTYIPVTQPAYSLGPDDYVVQTSTVGTGTGVLPGGDALRSGASPITGGFADDPLHVVRLSPANVYNYVQLQCSNRGNNYNAHMVEAFDQALVDQYGVRIESGHKADGICDPYLTGAVLAQLRMQRHTLYLNNYKFKLGWKYILLEPMDLVQITEPKQNIWNLTVRIIAMEEDQEGTWLVTCEDFFGANGSAVLYPPTITIEGTASLGTDPPNTIIGSGGGSAEPVAKQGSGSSVGATIINTQAPPPSINTPFILEPTSELLAAQGTVNPAVIVGLCGGANWGGADVYNSLDDVSFGQQGAFVGISTMGTTTADLPLYAGANPDSTDTLSVDLTESSGQLGSVSATHAAAYVTLCAIQNPGGLLEFLTFTTATLTATNKYDLTGLYRGLYGTSAVDHPLGAQFLFLATGNYYIQTLPQYVGRILYFKFPSFNHAQGVFQSLADATVYVYTPRGAAVDPTTFATLTTISNTYIQIESVGSTKIALRDALIGAGKIVVNAQRARLGGPLAGAGTLVVNAQRAKLGGPLKGAGTVAIKPVEKEKFGTGLGGGGGLHTVIP